MKTLTFDFYSDPGHGWVKVSFARLLAVLGPGWRSAFSSCSFERGEHAYLEEDCDAPRFVKACQAIGVEPKWRMRYSERESRIRNYASLYTGPRVPPRQAP